MLTTPPEFNFTVAVNISDVPPVFTIYDENNKVYDKPVTVTEDNTKIIYTLINNSESLIFVAPVINGDDKHDLTYEISGEGQVITFTDTDADVETICMQLQVIQSDDPDKTYTSPDPQIKNRGRG